EGLNRRIKCGDLFDARVGQAGVELTLGGRKSWCSNRNCRARPSKRYTSYSKVPASAEAARPSRGAMSTQCSAGGRWRPLEKGGRVLDSRFALPVGTVLDGSYRIVRVVGTGGLRITYDAEESELTTEAAV